MIENNHMNQISALNYTKGSEIENSGMADHIWKEKGNDLPLWEEVQIIDRAEHWRIRRLKESAHMLGYNDLLSRPNIKMNTIWESIIKRVRF